MRFRRFSSKISKIKKVTVILVLMHSIRPKHLISFKLHGFERKTNCLAKITLAKGFNSTQSAFFEKGFVPDKVEMGPC